MAKYMLKASLTIDGTRALMKEGGSSRKATVDNMIKGIGGNMEAFYYAFGETDAFVICDLPDSTTAAAVGLAVKAAGVVNVSMIPLLTVEEVDQACKKSITYRPPHL